MKRMLKVFLQGLLAIIPISVSIFTVVWLAGGAERLCGRAIKAVLGLFGYADWYFPSLGVLAGVMVVMLVGLLLEWWVVQRLFAWAESVLERIPLVKTIYGSIKDLLGMFHSEKDTPDKQVVVVDFGQGQRLLGLVTRSDLKGLPVGLDDGQDRVAVYVPMSYQLGGFTYLVPRKDLLPITMSVEDAMRFAVTAGVGGGTKSEA